MSVVFNGTTSDLRIPAAVNSPYPFSLSLWFYPTDTAGTVQTIHVQQNALFTEYLRLRLNGATGVLQWELIGGGAGPPGPTASGVNFNAWNHVFCQTNGMKLALNGGTLNTGGADSGPWTFSRRRMGAKSTALVFSDYFTGQIAEVIEVQSELNDIDADYRLRLAKGYYPLSVLNQAYSASEGTVLDVYYWPFAGRVVDEYLHSTALTPSNITYADQPPNMIYPDKARKVIKVPPAVAGRFVSLGGYYKTSTRTVLVG